MTETTPRDRLVATVAVLRAQAGDDINTRWNGGEAFVAAMEAEPDKPVQCPCCTKLVTLCVKHYALHEPGKKCSACREDE